jgi:hypothetical protein
MRGSDCGLDDIGVRGAAQSGPQLGGRVTVRFDEKDLIGTKALILFPLRADASSKVHDRRQLGAAAFLQLSKQCLHPD